MPEKASAPVRLHYAQRFPRNVDGKYPLESYLSPFIYVLVLASLLSFSTNEKFIKSFCFWRADNEKLMIS